MAASAPEPDAPPHQLWRVVHVVESLLPPGAARARAELECDRFLPHVLAYELDAHPPDVDSPATRIDLPRARLAATWRFMRALGALAPDVVHSHVSRGRDALLVACRRLGIPMVETSGAADLSAREAEYSQAISRDTRRTFWRRLLVRDAGAAARDSLHYWQERAHKFGARAVLDLRHQDLAAITAHQKAILLPLLRAELDGNESLILDFGCGPGRFTADLAAAINGRALGVDPIKLLLDLAPPGADVEYRLMNNVRIPADDRSADVIWICLVLGGIVSDAELARTLAEIHRMLRPGGLVFLVENTEARTGADYWRYRSIARYRQLFAFMELRHLTDYDDCGQRISVMAGRSARAIEGQ